jgi:hypothetical protein
MDGREGEDGDVGKYCCERFEAPIIAAAEAPAMKVPIAIRIDSTSVTQPENTHVAARKRSDPRDFFGLPGGGSGVDGCWAGG